MPTSVFTSFVDLAGFVDTGGVTARLIEEFDSQCRLSYASVPTVFISIPMSPINRLMSMSAYRAKSANIGLRPFYSQGIAEFRLTTCEKSSAWCSSTRSR